MIFKDNFTWTEDSTTLEEEMTGEVQIEGLDEQEINPKTGDVLP